MAQTIKCWNVWNAWNAPWNALKMSQVIEIKAMVHMERIVSTYTRARIDQLTKNRTHSRVYVNMRSMRSMRTIYQ